MCMSMIVRHGVKMKRCLCVSVQCAGCYFFFSEVDKDVVDPGLAATQLEEEQPFTVSLERCLALTEKQLVSTSLGIFRHEVARD